MRGGISSQPGILTATVEGHLRTPGLIRFLFRALECGRPSALNGFTCWFDRALLLFQQFRYPALYIALRGSGSLSDIHDVPSQLAECFSTGIGCGQPAYRSSHDASDQKTRDHFPGVVSTGAYYILYLAILLFHLILLGRCQLSSGQFQSERLSHPTMVCFPNINIRAKGKTYYGVNT